MSLFSLRVWSVVNHIPVVGHTCKSICSSKVNLMDFLKNNKKRTHMEGSMEGEVDLAGAERGMNQIKKHCTEFSKSL